MKKIVALILVALSLNASAQMTVVPAKPKLSPLTRHYLHDVNSNQGKLAPGYIYNKLSDGKTYLSALIKISDADKAAKGLDGIGAKVGTKAGKIWTVKVPVDKFIEFTTLSGISYIQLDEPLKPMLNVARKTTRVDSAQAGYGLPKGYSGEDVVVGVIDFGFDYNHPTFYDTLGKKYRIKAVWEMGCFGIPPAGYTFGRELTDSNMIKAAGTDNASQTHGSSTAGMAAGSGFGGPTGSKFRGMAYAADIALVGVRRDSIGGQWMEGSFSDFLDGVSYLFKYGESVGKPVVVNISWGSQSGAHDGTSLFAQACDALSGPGKIVVMSAGNEGTENIHLSKKFTATDSIIKTYLTFSPSTYQRTWVDIWGQSGKTFCAKATLYHNGIAGQTTGYVCINDLITSTYLMADNGVDTCYVEYITSSAEENGKPRMTINLFNKATDSIGISVKGTDGSIDMWDEYYYYGFPHGFQSTFSSLGDATAVNGNTITTVSDMGSANSVLLVGAYCSKNSYVDINGNNASYASYVGPNQLVPFSSRGPMVDGRIKPDITAPGLTIATATNSHDLDYTETGSKSGSVVSKYSDPATGHNYYYVEFAGTSASGPAASGIVALLLQVDPTMDPAKVKNYIFKSAINDSYTSTLPAAGNNNWGHGKINAYGALKLAVQDATASVAGLSENKLNCALFPNPNDGSFSLEYTGKESQRLNVYIYNEVGSLVCMKPWQVNKGVNRSNMSLPEVAKGVYFVKVVTSLGGSTEIKTLVK